ncbi:MAG TPA: TatD family hydrolase, partial [Candidatus Ozemobacteraceae bacterium]|nr:TatD family hydrolase [Candidatus Ozemobacteraceae bacterium]
MTGWTDTHCHLDAPALAGDWPGILKRAHEAGVARIIIPGVTGPVPDGGWPEESVRRAWGVHPAYGGDVTADQIRRTWDQRGYEAIAIGECGLDVTSGVSMEHQITLFTAQAEIAQSAGLPLLIHLRGAWETARMIL